MKVYVLTELRSNCTSKLLTISDDKEKVFKMAEAEAMAVHDTYMQEALTHLISVYDVQSTEELRFFGGGSPESYVAITLRDGSVTFQDMTALLNAKPRI